MLASMDYNDAFFREPLLYRKLTKKPNDRAAIHSLEFR